MPEYIRSPYAPDQRTMLDLMRLASTDRSRADRERAAVRAQGVMNIGQLIASTLAGIRQEREQRAVNAMKAEQQAYDRRQQSNEMGLREMEITGHQMERAQAAARQAELDKRQSMMDAQKAGDARANKIGYGPMAESDVDVVMQSPERAGDVRYSFGPGTAEGPELMPTKDQQQALTMRQKLEGMGYSFGPNGQVIPPQKPEPQTGFSLSPGQTRFGPDGKPIVSLPPAPREAAGPRPLTQTAEAQIIQRLNTQWGSAQKPIKELERQVALMDTGMEAVKRGDLAQGAQMVLVTFQKILDPPSVVRESEFMRSAAGQSMMNRVQGAYERLVKGGAGVTAGELQKFSDLAREAAAAQRTAANLDAVKKRIGGIAERYNIPNELIFEDAAPMDAPPPPNIPAGDTFIEAIDQQGNVHHAPAGTPLPAGWKLKG